MVQAVATWALPLLFAITMHEAAHGFAALRFGDDTARRAGRLSINPLRHVDPFGTVILPAMLLLVRSPFLFGWAKPVPVDFSRLRPFRMGMVLVAAAGPITNLVLATLSAAGLHLVDKVPVEAGEWLALNLINSIKINLVLAVFNMLPIPPLDGGRVAVGILPRSLAIPLARMEPMGFPILIVLLLVLPMMGVRVFETVVGVPVAYLFDLVITLVGIG